MIKSFVMALLLLAGAPLAASPLADSVARVEADWAHANYAVEGKAAKAAAFQDVIDEADALAERFPNAAEPLVWRGVALTAKAGAVGGLPGFVLVKKARAALEEAQRIDPNAAGGLGLVQLGILYYQVPGFPIAFGDRHKAAAFLTRAMAVAPDSDAVNLAYADFLATGGKRAQALDVLHAMLKRPLHSRSVADAGRRSEAATLLAQVQSGKLVNVRGE